MNIAPWLKAFCLFLLFPLFAYAASPTWQPLGLHGGSVSVLASNSDGNTLYAGTAHGVFLSRNQGARWEGFRRGLPDNSPIQALVLNETDDQVFVATAQAGIFSSLWVAGELRWRPFNEQLPALQINDLAFDTQSAILYAAVAGQGIWQRALTADAWTLLDNSLKATRVQHLQVPAPGVLLALSEQHLLRVIAGEAAQLVPLPSIAPLHLLSAQGEHWWLVAQDALWYTADAGLSWQSRALPSGMPLSLLVHPRQPESLYLSTDQGNFFSHTGGQSWQTLNLPVRDTPILSWAAPPQADLLFAGAAHLGVFKSSATAEIWEVARFGLQATGVKALLTDSDTLYLAASGLGLLQSQNGGRDWQPRGLGLDAPINGLTAVQTSQERLYAATTKGIFSTTRTTLRWQPELSGVISYAVETDPLVAGRLYAATAEGVYLQAAEGESWRLQGLGGQQISAILATADGLVYAGTANGELYYSADGGAYWILEVALNAGAVQDLHVHAHAGQNRLFAATATGLWQRDASANWLPVTDLAFSVWQLDTDPHHSERLYAATLKGVWRSDDDGTQWYSLNAGLPAVPFHALGISRTAPTRVYAGSWGAGLFALNLDTAANFGLNAAALSSLSATALSALPPESFATLDAASVRLLPVDSLRGLRSQQLAQLSAAAVSALSPEQFQAIPREALFGLHTGNFSGLSDAILQQFSVLLLTHVDRALLQRLDSATLHRLLQQFDAPTLAALPPANWLPLNWQSATPAQAWQPPVGSLLSVPAFAQTHNPVSATSPASANFQSPMLLAEIQQSLAHTDFSDGHLSQNPEGVLLLQTHSNTYVYLPAPNGIIQVAASATPGWKVNTQGQIELTSATRQRITLNATSPSLTHLSTLAGGGDIWRNLQGDVLIQDASVNPPRYQMLGFAFTLAVADAAATPGIYALSDSQFKLVYPDLNQQAAHAAITEPQMLLDELYRLGAELVLCQSDGACWVQLSGAKYVLRPQAEVLVTRLPEETQMPPSINLSSDEQGLLWLSYGVQWNTLWITSRLQVEAEQGDSRLQQQNFQRLFENFAG